MQLLLGRSLEPCSVVVLFVVVLAVVYYSLENLFYYFVLFVEHPYLSLIHFDPKEVPEE